MRDLELSEDQEISIWHGLYYSVEIVKDTGIVALVTSRAYTPDVK